MGTRRWTKAEIDYLLKAYAERSNADLAVFLHRSARAIGLKARSLGVHKSPEFAERQHKVGQFKPGYKPFNAGRKQEYYMSAEGIANSSRTRFRKGECRQDNPKNRKPGYECLRTEEGRSYWWIKPHDGRRMMPKHRYIWEQAHGPIPKGWCVMFKDKNTTNCDLDNLYIISRGAQLRKNYDALPEERKAACRAKIQESRNAKIRADKVRLRWGLQPLTRLVKRLPK